MFYERLKELCAKNGISVTNLVKELGMSTGNISKWKGGNVPKSQTVSALAEYFGVSSDFLLGIEGSVTPAPAAPMLSLSDDEKWFILKLRELDKEGRTVVENALVEETRRMDREKGTAATTA